MIEIWGRTRSTCGRCSGAARNSRSRSADTMRAGFERALADEWMDYQPGTLWPAVKEALLGLVRTPPKGRGPSVYRWFELEIERPDPPALAAWRERLEARPAYQETVMVSFAKSPRLQPTVLPALAPDLGDRWVVEEVEQPVGGDPCAALRALQLVEVRQAPEEGSKLTAELEAHDLVDGELAA